MKKWYSLTTEMLCAVAFASGALCRLKPMNDNHRLRAYQRFRRR